MSQTCAFPNCNRHAEKNGYCVGHRIYAGTAVAEKKRPKPIPKRSVTMKENMKKYKPLVKAFLALPENQVCAIQSPVCTKVATTVNHTKRRGKNLLNIKDMEPCCGPCNGFIEDNHSWGESRGHLKPAHHKN